MKRLYYFLIRGLLCIILFLGLAIVCKGNVQYKNVIHDKLFCDSISFSYFQGIYNNYLGGIFPIENVFDVNMKAVFDEKLSYSDISAYGDGAALVVSSNYMVPNMEKGIVVYVGQKDKYNNVVIVENQDGVDIWYGNLCNTLVKLYDNIESGTYLGESCDNMLYLVYTRGNEYLDYRDYLG